MGGITTSWSISFATKQFQAFSPFLNGTEQNYLAKPVLGRTHKLWTFFIIFHIFQFYCWLGGSLLDKDWPRYLYIRPCSSFL